MNLLKNQKKIFVNYQAHIEHQNFRSLTSIENEVKAGVVNQ